MQNSTKSDILPPILNEIEKYRQKAKVLEASVAKSLKASIKRKYGLSVKFNIFISEPVGYRIKCVKHDKQSENELTLRLEEGKIFKIMLFPKEMELEQYLDDLIKKTEVPIFLLQAERLFSSLKTIEQRIKKEEQIKERIEQW